MADEKKQKAAGGQKPQGGQGKPQGKKAKPEKVEAAAEQPSGKPARPKATNRETARMRDRYYKEVQPALMKELGLENPMAAPKLEKIIVNMGVGEATQNAKLIDPAATRSRPDHRPEAGDHQGPQVDCGVQGARRHAHRRDGDAARRSHVRVLRSPGECGAAACA